MKCNCKSLLIALIVAFIVVWGTDFLIHGIWLAPTYGATKEIWRPEAEMIKKMPYMFAGQAVVAIAFTSMFALFVADRRSLTATLLFAFLFSLFAAGTNIIMYVVLPYPGHLVVKWILAGIAQMLLLGIVVHFVYRAP